MQHVAQFKRMKTQSFSSPQRIFSPRSKQTLGASPTANRYNSPSNQRHPVKKNNSELPPAVQLGRMQVYADKLLAPTKSAENPFFQPVLSVKPVNIPPRTPTQSKRAALLLTLDSEF